MTQPLRIVLCYPTESHHQDRIRSVVTNAGLKLELIDAGQENVDQALQSGAEIFCGHVKTPVAWDRVVGGGTLKWIQSSAAGLDHCLVPPVVESDIIVTSASGVLSHQVAEQTTALLTGLLRSFPVFFHAQLRREYIRKPTRDLRGSRTAILGYGGVGRRVAEVLHPFKTQITAFDLYPFDPEPAAELLHIDEFDALAATFDNVILCLPLTERTHGMFDAAKLAQLKPGVVFINVARGPIVVERDMVAALRSGQISAAGVDVAEIEPLPADSPLWGLPNMIITPHVGGQCATRAADMTDFFCENLRRYLGGEPLLNYVDKRQGFPVRTQQAHQPQREPLAQPVK